MNRPMICFKVVCIILAVAFEGNTVILDAYGWLLVVDCNRYSVPGMIGCKQVVLRSTTSLVIRSHCARAQGLGSEHATYQQATCHPRGILGVPRRQGPSEVSPVECFSNSLSVEYSCCCVLLAWYSVLGTGIFSVRWESLADLFVFKSDNDIYHVLHIVGVVYHSQTATRTLYSASVVRSALYGGVLGKSRNRRMAQQEEPCTNISQGFMHGCILSSSNAA